MISTNSSTQTQHTPGPWTMCKYGYEFGIYVEGDPCAPRRSNDLALVRLSDNTEADARLIASAPALLAALEAIVQGIDNGFSRYEMGAALHELRSIAAPAIAEARGDA